MSEKPEALKLVNVFAVEKELRRLYAENERLREALEIVLAADYDPKDSLTYLRSNTREVIKAALRREDV